MVRMVEEEEEAKPKTKAEGNCDGNGISKKNNIL